MKKYLFLSAFVINSLFADVFEYNKLKTKHSNDVIVKAMHNIIQVITRGNEISKPIAALSGKCKIEDIKKYKEDDGYKDEFQMSGWGMFVPNGATQPEDIKVCIAVKRKKAEGDNNEDVPNYWHTERQIVDYLLRNNGWQSPGKDGTTNIGTDGIAGTLHVYTAKAPCGDADPAYTAPISCITYYKNLQAMLQHVGITLKVYASEIPFSVDNYQTTYAGYADEDKIKKINAQTIDETAEKKNIKAEIQSVINSQIQLITVNATGIFTMQQPQINWQTAPTANDWANLLKILVYRKGLSNDNKAELFHALFGINLEYLANQ